jgi:hypothetical protein
MNMGNDREALAEIQIASRLDPAKQLYHAREQELMRLMRAGNPAQ